MFKYVKQLTSFVAMLAVLFVFSTETMAAKKSKTLKNTQKKGFVRCGVSQGLPGFSNADASGNWTGVDVDVCRAVAAAVLGDARLVNGHVLVVDGVQTTSGGNNRFIKSGSGMVREAGKWDRY